MGEIYIRDGDLANDYNGRGPRRSHEDIVTILTTIIPRPVKNIREQRLGYIASFPNDLDTNYIFRPEIVTKLQQKNLSARLSYETEAKRDIYILKTPQ